MKFGKFEVNVIVDDVNLPEYGEETQVVNNIANVSCWVPSMAGQVSLMHRLKSVFYLLSCRVSLCPGKLYVCHMRLVLVFMSTGNV